MKILLTEWLKTKRTPLRWLTFLTPVIFAGLFLLYFSLKQHTQDLQPFLFGAFFQAWTALFLPLDTGLMAGFMVHQEELAGGFNALLGTRPPRGQTYLAKLALLILLTSASTFLATFIFVQGVSDLLGMQVSWPIFLTAAIMALAGTLPLLALNLWISLAWGMGASIGLGGAGLLIASLMITNLGDKIWQFIPWAWPVRLSQLPGTYLKYLPGLSTPPPLIASGYPIHETIKGFIPAALFFLVIVAGGILWFNRWEGRKIYD